MTSICMTVSDSVIEALVGTLNVMLEPHNVAEVLSQYEESLGENVLTKLTILPEGLSSTDFRPNKKRTSSPRKDLRLPGSKRQARFGHLATQLFLNKSCSFDPPSVLSINALLPAPTRERAPLQVCAMVAITDTRQIHVLNMVVLVLCDRGAKVTNGKWREQNGISLHSADEKTLSYWLPTQILFESKCLAHFPVLYPKCMASRRFASALLQFASAFFAICTRVILPQHRFTAMDAIALTSSADHPSHRLCCSSQDLCVQQQTVHTPDVIHNDCLVKVRESLKHWTQMEHQLWPLQLHCQMRHQSFPAGVSGWHSVSVMRRHNVVHGSSESHPTLHVHCSGMISWEMVS